jgi:RNA polymerase sigma factor (sigma-70 family)
VYPGVGLRSQAIQGLNTKGKMTDDAPQRRSKSPSADSVVFLHGSASLLEALYLQAQAGRWGLSPERWAATLERSAKKRLTPGTSTPRQLEEYLRALHLQDLALASACAEGCEAAWEQFFATYRVYLHAAAAAILHCPASAPEATELADSLFADLYGLDGGKGGERSLFRYFHGRSSLKTWLRAVLAQRHIDAIRAGRRFEELGDDDSQTVSSFSAAAPHASLSDPHRPRYVALFTRALSAALQKLQPEDRERLRYYYAEEKTLAEIGRLFEEHESSVSRHLERSRIELRQQVENILRRGFTAANGSAAEPGLSDAEIALCVEYSAENTPLDLDKLLPRSKPQGPAAGKRQL